MILGHTRGTGMIIMVPVGRIQRRKRTGAGEGVNESCETRFDAVARKAVAFRS